MRETPYQDPQPARVDFRIWNELFQKIPKEIIENYKYYNQEADWARYLSPPQTFAIYGARHLLRLKFDNSLSALRLWGFVFNETERLFRARQIGRKIIAVMGDLGGLPPLVYSFSNLIAFYPDCLWWQPFLQENYTLFEAAATYGLPETSCYSRAVIGAFLKNSYFPKPDLIIASTGASCDDYSSVMQIVHHLYKERFIWLEIPPRKNISRGRSLLASEYKGLLKALEELSGERMTIDKLRKGLLRVNRIRRTYQRLKDLVGKARVSPLPALEMLWLEFGNLHFYSDIEEWEKILNNIFTTVRRRVKEGKGVLKEEAKKIVWVTPPADPYYLTYFEDCGARIVGSEYLINQALGEIDTSKDLFFALADAYLRASLIGRSEERARLIIEAVKRYDGRGVVISGIFGASHCAYETEILRDEIRKKAKVPVFAFDIPLPSEGIPKQTKTRIQSFLENL